MCCPLQPRRTLRFLLAGSLSFLFLAPSLPAQIRYGTVAGYVFDLNENPLPGVVIGISNAAAGFSETAVTTDTTGKYVLSNLPPGKDYLLRATFPGFATMEIRLEVRPGRQTVQVITMRPEADVAEVIEVVGRTDVVQLDKTDTTTTFEAGFMENLPVIGRDYQDVLILAPGVKDEDGDGNVNILGSRDRDVKTMIEGMDVTDPFTGKDPVAFNLEAIQELELVRAGAGAQYGGKSGGFVNIVTKSGGNDFSGAFKFFYRTDDLDGDGAGSDPPVYHGGTPNAPELSDVKFEEYRPFLSLGGPVLRDRVWYYVAMEYLNIDTPINTINRSFATNFEGFRNFAKLTWQASSSNKLSLSFTHDPFEMTNQGVDSITAVESGYTLERIRNNLILQDSYILSPRALLQSTLSWVDFGFDTVPGMEPDLNGNGFLYRRPALLPQFDIDCTEETPYLCDSWLDRNRDGYITDLEDPYGFFEARYRDTGDDFNGDGIIDDQICIPSQTGQTICEGDTNRNGRIEGRDIDFHRETLGIANTFGPYYLSATDERTRLSLAEQLSLEIDDFYGNHTLDVGAGYDRDDYTTDIERRNILITRKNGSCKIVAETPLAAAFLTPICEVDAQIPYPRRAEDLDAGADRFHLFGNDRYQPIPNLTIGLGVRWDREEIEASGFRPFDPAGEASTFRRVGLEIGNLHGPLMLEPLLTGPERFGRVQALRRAALRVLTAPESSPAFDIPEYYLDLRGSVSGEVEQTVRIREDFSVDNNNLSPRVSVAWDPWGNGKTKLYTTWGRFYDNLFLEAVVQEEAPAFVTRIYRYDYDGIVGDCDFETTNCDKPENGPFNNYFGEKIGGFSPPSVQMVAHDLKSPHADEFSIGFERELAPEFSLGMTYVRRKWSDQLQDTDVNHLPVDTNGDGLINRDDDVIGLLIGRSPVADGLPDLALQNPFFNQVFLVGNFNNSDYEGIELTLTRRMHRNWQMMASYTYSEAVGAAADYLSELGNDPAATEDEFGFLNFDQTHTVKFSALTHLPRDFTLAGIATWSSGYPYSLIRETSSFDTHYYSQFRRYYPTGKRNDQRNDSFYTFSTSIMKGFVVGEVSGRFRFDIENLLNADDIRVFDINDVSEANQVRAERRFGRRFEIGLEMFF